MSAGDIVLEYELAPGRNADAFVAAESLQAWIEFAREAARALDPGSEIRVELIGNEKGSLRQLLRIVEENAKNVAEGGSEYPYLKKAAIGLALAASTAVMQTAIQEAMKPAQEVVALSKEDRALLEGMRDRIQSSPAAQTSAKRYFREVEQDPGIDSVKVANGFQEPPAVVIPKTEFAERGGLWEPQQEAAPEHKVIDTWDVVLVKAPFVAEPRWWTFSRDGVPFSARMQDEGFLAAIAAKTLPIGLHEGVMMRIEIEYRERLDGQVWQYVDRTRKVLRVLSPRPAPAPLPLALPNPPKKGN